MQKLPHVTGSPRSSMPGHPISIAAAVSAAERGPRGGDELREPRVLREQRQQLHRAPRRPVRLAPFQRLRQRVAVQGTPLAQSLWSFMGGFAPVWYGRGKTALKTRDVRNDGAGLEPDRVHVYPSAAQIIRLVCNESVTEAEGVAIAQAFTAQLAALAEGRA
jgi:hypothetical protein